jgi:type I restriction enzyme S subunit
VTGRVPLKHVAIVSARIGWHGLSTDDYGDDGDYLVPGTAFADGAIDWQKCQRVSRDIWTRDPMIQLSGGDVLITKDGTIGKVAFISNLPGNATLNSGVFRIRPRPVVDGRYLFWVFQSRLTEDFIDLLRQGSTIDHLYQRDLVGFRVPVPPLGNQRRIAGYLDREIVRIDELLRKKRHLVALMTTRRRAVAATLVARPIGAPRADIPWLDSVPSRWPSVALGLLADIFNGTTPEGNTLQPSGGMGSGIAWTTSGDIDQGVVTVPTAYISEQVRVAHGLRVAPAGSIVVGLVGQGRTRALSARLAIPTTLNQNLAAICPRDDRLTPAYLGLMLELSYDDLRSGGRGGNQAAINCEMLKAYRIPLAPRADQERLVNEILVSRARADAMLSLIRRSIDLLIERRQALITAAVTERARNCERLHEA